jgi:hypothetical protein
VFSPGAGTVTNGNAHRRWLQGTGAKMAGQRQWMPKDLLTCVSEDQTQQRKLATST